MLKSAFSKDKIEAGCDEAGRGCLAGPVFAAAVILPKSYKHELLNDSKKLNHKKREQLRGIILQDAIAWSVAEVSPQVIDEINILNASFLAMHKAIDGLSTAAELLLIDGNRFKAYPGIDHQCIIKGDGKYLSIAAASILAKTFRDDFMRQAHKDFPVYLWDANKGYPTLAHKNAIQQFGLCLHHRKTFNYHIQYKFGF